MVRATAVGFIEAMTESYVGQKQTHMVKVLIKQPWMARDGQQIIDHLEVDYLGERADNIAGKYHEGDYVRMDFTLRSEYYEGNGRYYPRLSGLTLGIMVDEKTQNAAPSSAQPSYAAQGHSQQVAQPVGQMQSQMNVQQGDPFGQAEEDDTPF